MSHPDRKVALVTGASRGVGRTVAVALARAGWNVGLTARTGDELEETAALVEDSDARALAVPADVTDQQQVEQAVAAVERDLGSIDVAVNNAGTARVVGPLWESPADEWWADVETNLRGTFLVCRAVVPAMVERGRGRILNVSSYVAVRPSPYLSSYASAKAGVLSLTEALAASLEEHGIAVFAITPGLVRTALLEHLEGSDEGQRWLPDLASRPALDPELVGRLAVFLASGRGDELTGRFFHALDDVEELARRSAEIRRNDLFVSRLRRDDDVPVDES